jgi:hypothetical protein
MHPRGHPAAGVRMSGMCGRVSGVCAASATVPAFDRIGRSPRWWRSRAPRSRPRRRPPSQWEDALVGALAGAGMLLLVGGVALVVRRHREHAVAVS